MHTGYVSRRTAGEKHRYHRNVVRFVRDWVVAA
jgi:hypothetical protein